MSNPEDTSEPAEETEPTDAKPVEAEANAEPEGEAEPAAEPAPATDDPYPQDGEAEVEYPEADVEGDVAEPVSIEVAPEDESVAEPTIIVPQRETPLRRRRPKQDGGDSLWELAKTVFYAVLIAVFIRSVLFQPFNIPSQSMENTLLVGDYLFISKFSYGYSLYSLPWGYWLRRHMPSMEGRILASEPERGDIVVFKYPPDNKTDYIKRVIGLPGDRIQMKNGVLFINGAPVPKVHADDYVETDEYGHTRNIPRFKETLPNGVSYFVLDRYPDAGFDTTDVYLVPAGHYFMMGDNRDNSDDSRGHVGMVPFENLEGRARFIWFSIDDSARWFEPWTWPAAIRYDRIATIVD